MRSTDDLCDALGVAFSEQQLAAITAPLAPGVIIAGAGSGKTTVMAARVVWLVGTGQVSPEQVLGLTFTRKAAAELSARVRQALSSAGVLDPDSTDEGEQLILTYDAFAARLIAEHGLRIGAESDPVMITGASRFRLAARVVGTAAGPFEHLSRLRPDTITQRVLDLDAELTAHLVPTERVGRHTRVLLKAIAGAPVNRQGAVYASLKQAKAAAEERLELVGLAEEYSQLKRQLGYVEFSDQMALAAHLAQSAPEVSAALREQFRVVLLDEYQDTSSAQATLLKALFSGDEPATGRGHPVTAVGDPCQAIYGWRGAAASNILAFASDFPDSVGRPARRFALTVNRRSGPAILAAANALAGNLRADPAMDFDGQQLELLAPPGTPPGEVVVAAFDTWADEVTFVADRIAEAQAAGQVASWADIAVLSRRNAQIAALYGELVTRGIPVEIVGLGGLLNLPEIVDLTSTLALLEDTDPNPAMIRLLTGPRWAIGKSDLMLLGQRALQLAGPRTRPDPGLSAALDGALSGTDPTVAVSLLEALENPGDVSYSPAARQRFERFSRELRALRRHAAEPVFDLVRRVVAVLGLEVELGSRGLGTEQLGAFLDAVAGYVDVDGDASLSGLLSYLEAERDHGVGLEQAVVSDADSVKLLTVHKAKGLEWELVFVPGLAADVFPNLRVSGNWLKAAASVPADLRGDAASIPQLAEVSDPAASGYAQALAREALFAEDRLAYVAVTRARQRLVATTHTWDAGLIRPRSPSAYFATLAALGRVLAEAPGAATENPYLQAEGDRAWPFLGDPATRVRRERAAEEVRRAQEALRDGASFEEDGETREEGDVVRAWDSALALLSAELTQPERRPTPGYLSATSVVRALGDPEVFATELARPMPRLASHSQRRGSDFHRWLERRFRLLPTLDGVEEEPGVPDPGFAELSAAFERGQFATRIPTAVEVPFSMLLGTTLVRGRIDAVFETAGGWLIVDWKTGAADRADPIQLALYRLAWAELTEASPGTVAAAFYDIRADRLVEVPHLPDRAELERSLAAVLV